MHYESNDSIIDGDTIGYNGEWPSGLTVLKIIGNNNTLKNLDFPASNKTLPQSIDSIQIQGSNLQLTNIGRRLNFHPDALPADMFNYIVTTAVGNAESDQSSHVSQVPSIVGSYKLQSFNILGTALRGALPGQTNGTNVLGLQTNTGTSQSLHTFKIGGFLGRSAGSSHPHAGLNSSQAFPNFNKLNIANLSIVGLTTGNTAGGSPQPAITSAYYNNATNHVFGLANFESNAIIDLRFNAFSPTTMNNILKSILDSNNGTSGTGKTIKCNGNERPTNLVDITLSDTGNTTVNDLKSAGYTIEYSFGGGWKAANWKKVNGAY